MMNLIALACSTGGPNALQKVIPLLPKNLNSSFIVIQHMPAGFTKSLSHRLNELSEMEVREAKDGELVKKGIVYVAKGGCQLRVKTVNNQSFFSIEKGNPRGGLSPCADVLYESLVDSIYDEITCVVLTGMGGDGTLGIKKLEKQKKIYVIAQNQETCTVYGMPKVIAESGLVDEVVPLNQVAEAIVNHVGVQ